MKVVILAGGKGARIREESEYRPKPMIEIGGMPILWHIMKLYSYFGYNEFIICTGYKQEYIKEWFHHYFVYANDITFDYRKIDNKKNGFPDAPDIQVEKQNSEDWKVTIVNTGLDTMTGGRILRVKDYIGDSPFLLTYGDAVCNVDIDELVRFHKANKKMATITAVIQKQEKGILEISEIGEVRSFREKQSVDSTPINAGFMVIEPGIFDYLEDDRTVFERVVLEKLAAEGKLMSYMHEGFWQCMDSVREKEILEVLWEKGNAPWKVW